MRASSQGLTLNWTAEVATIIGALCVVFAVYQGAMARLRATVFSRMELRQKLDQLACGVPVEYVTSLFGAPTFRTARPEAAGKLADATEPIFRARHAWLQVLVRNAGAAVEAFSVTVTDPRFRYRTRYLTNEQVDLRHGASRFAELRGPVDGWSSRRSARRFGVRGESLVRQPWQLPGIRPVL